MLYSTVSLLMQFLYTDLIAVILDKKASTIVFYVTIILTIIQNFNIKKMDIPIIKYIYSEWQVLVKRVK